MKEKKKKIGIICTLIIVIVIIGVIIHLINSNNVSDNEIDNATNNIITQTETYEINFISLETRKVNESEYQILNIDYYDSEHKNIKKSILVDLERGSCLWNADDQIALIYNNEESYSIYDNSLTINESDKNTLVITKDYYDQDDSEMIFLTVQINLTQISYESLGI